MSGLSLVCLDTLACIPRKVQHPSGYIGECSKGTSELYLFVPFALPVFLDSQANMDIFLGYHGTKE